MVVWCFLLRLCARLHGLIGVPQCQSQFTFMGGSGKHTTTRRGTGKKCVEGRGWELVLFQRNDCNGGISEAWRCCLWAV